MTSRLSGPAPLTRARNEISTNKLLQTAIVLRDEGTAGIPAPGQGCLRRAQREGLDVRTPRPPSRAHPSLAALESLHRSQDANRQGAGRNERVPPRLSKPRLARARPPHPQRHPPLRGYCAARPRADSAARPCSLRIQHPTKFPPPPAVGR